MELDFSFLQQSTLFAKYFANSQKLNLLYEIEDYRDVVSNVRRLSESLVKELFAVEQLDPYYPLKEQKQRSFRSDLFIYKLNTFIHKKLWNSSMKLDGWVMTLFTTITIIGLSRLRGTV